MKIKELINKLSVFDEETEVLIDKDFDLDFIIEQDDESVSLNTFER